MKKLLFSFIAVMFLAVSLAQAQDFPNRLFIIERSKNANIVCYDINLDAKGQIDSKEPVDAYWLLYAEKNGEREDLSAFDKKAYGFKTDYDEADKRYILTLKAVKERKMNIVNDGGKYRAKMTINDQDAYLDKVYIQSKDGLFGIPKVYFYVLSGTSVLNNEPVEEKIILKK